MPLYRVSAGAAVLVDPQIFQSLAGSDGIRAGLLTFGFDALS